MSAHGERHPKIYLVLRKTYQNLSGGYQTEAHMWL